jgi:ComF family protein
VFKDLYSYIWDALNILFPPRCAGCNIWGERFCTACIKKTKIIGSAICPKCGEPQLSNDIKLCGKCLDKKLCYENLRSWAIYDGSIKKAIQNLKYKRDIGLGEILSRPLIEMVLNNRWQIDLITSVPLDVNRLKMRGYNQSVLLAKPVAWKTKLPFNKNAIKRVKVTRSQVGLTYNERKTNVSDAFLAESKVVSKKSILLIDDVVTTGATINSCASALQKAQATTIYGLTLARSPRFQF